MTEERFPIDDRTHARLMFAAGNTMKRLERDYPDDWTNLVATAKRTGQTNVVWSYGGPGIVCSFGGRIIIQFDLQTLRSLVMDDAPEILISAFPEVPDDASELDGLSNPDGDGVA